MPDAEALAVAYQLTDGLGTMHEAGIIHRDLKPRTSSWSAPRAATP